jgi:hypothetical protein
MLGYFSADRPPCRKRAMGFSDLLTVSDITPSLLSRLHAMSNKYTTPKGTRFFFGKGPISHLSELADKPNGHRFRVPDRKFLITSMLCSYSLSFFLRT